MWVNTGLLWALRIALQQDAPEDIEVGLYTNAVTWSETTVLGDLTEPTQSGYARQLTSGWSAPGIVSGTEGESVATNVTFTNGDATNIVAEGFFYISATTGILLGGDPFPAPETILAGGGILLFQPAVFDTAA